MDKVIKKPIIRGTAIVRRADGSIKYVLEFGGEKLVKDESKEVTGGADSRNSP